MWNNNARSVSAEQFHQFRDICLLRNVVIRDNHARTFRLIEDNNGFIGAGIKSTVASVRAPNKSVLLLHDRSRNSLSVLRVAIVSSHYLTYSLIRRLLEARSARSDCCFIAHRTALTLYFSFPLWEIHLILVSLITRDKLLFIAFDDAFDDASRQF